MSNGQFNEMRFVLRILKDPEIEYNASSLAKVLHISSMGALKIAKKLQKENILSFRMVGKANVLSLNLHQSYARQYVLFLLKKESESSSPYLKRWIRELGKIKSAEGIILFGSVLHKEKEAHDIDILVLVNKKSLNFVKKEIDEINQISDKKVHPLYQTKEDVAKHIREKNKVMCNAIKGIYVSGEHSFIEVLTK